MTRSLLVSAVLLTACETATDTAETAGECGVSITSTLPATNAVDAYYRGNIEFKLSAADSTATIETSIVGHQETSEDGLTVYWIIDEPLQPSTPYSATLHYCTGDAPIEFSTSALGTSIADPSLLVGTSYLLNLKDARVTEPPGIGSLISSELGNVSIYVGITEMADPKIKMIGALGREDVENTQEYCDPSIDFPEADFSAAPHFEIGGEGATTITVADVSVTIDNLRIAGDFAADLTYFGGGVLEGTIDTRPLDDAFFDGEEGSICTTAGSLGVTCEECGGDAPGLFCLSLKADSIQADLAPLELMVIEGTDCLGCLTGAPADASETCEQEPPPV